MGICICLCILHFNVDLTGHAVAALKGMPGTVGCCCCCCWASRIMGLWLWSQHGSIVWQILCVIHTWALLRQQAGHKKENDDRRSNAGCN
jgi:hypothetical protein